jgi:hypothetical protein
MNQFGVSSEKLKKIAKPPAIPVLTIARDDHPKQFFQWYGATVKNVESTGEQSAAGLAETNGAILLNISTNCFYSFLLYCQNS